jgi:hypothetical protein
MAGKMEMRGKQTVVDVDFKDVTKRLRRETFHAKPFDGSLYTLLVTEACGRREENIPLV